jgi:hypothetical protein
MRYKYEEARGVRVMDSEVMQEYLDGKGGRRNKGIIVE